MTHREVRPLDIMFRHIILLCIVAVLSWSVVSAHVLVPPKGYSVGFTGTIRNGVQKYVCKHGYWIKTGSSADVISSDGSKLGTYRAVYDQNARTNTYYWNILNSAGGSHESGHAVSVIQASPLKSVRVSSSAIPEYLAIVKVRRGGGDTSQVTFVSLTGTRGGLPPRQALCTGYGSTSGVPFGGKFTFYTVDREPPQVPPSLTANGTFVQSVFCEGKISYRFTGGRWIRRGFSAKMSEVAGGSSLGQCGTVLKPDAYGSKVAFRFGSPNGFWLQGRQCTQPLKISSDGCPWQLLAITTSGGTESPMGRYKYVLIGATYGGEPPNLAARTEGMTWGSCFTAQAYLFAE